MGTVSILFFVCVAFLIRGYDTFQLRGETTGTSDCNGRKSLDDKASCTTVYKEKDKQCMFIVHNQALSDHDVEIKFGYLENEESEGCVLDSLDFISSKTEGQSYGDSLLGRVFASIGNTIDQGLRKDEPPPLAGFKAFITFKPPHDCTCDKNQVCVQQGSRKVHYEDVKYFRWPGNGVVVPADRNLVRSRMTGVVRWLGKRGCKDGGIAEDSHAKSCLERTQIKCNNHPRSQAPDDRSLEKHSSIYAECQLDVPKEIEVRYKWKFNGSVVGDYNTDTGFGVHPRGVLEIDSFVEEFEGQYACIAKSVLGTARHTFQYSMVSSCRIKIRPGPGIVKRNAGRSALLRCNAKPFNKVNTVLWKKMGVPIDYTNERFEMKSNFYLQINKIQLSDQGDYSCHVEANNGCRTSKRGKLIVLDYLPLNKYCGKSTLDEYYEESRLTQSTDAETNENPWHVIFRTKTSFSRTFCGGTLISRRFVLTAAHCITGFKIFSSKTVALFLGTTDCLGGGIKRTVRNYTIHPKYKKAAKFDNDIAIIELDTPVEYGDSIRPICLGEKGFVDESFLEKDLQTSLSPSSGRVVGCGRASESGNLHAVLQVLNLPYVPRKQCEESLKGETLPDSMFCAGSAIKDTGDACQGDSGGGLIMQTNDQWILVGIVSAGFGCDRAEHYGMYTNVGFVYDWVNGITRFDDDQDDTYLPETGCIAGQACEVKCQNGGTLVWQNNKSRCYCIDGFEGDDCSKYTDGDTNKALRFKNMLTTTPEPTTASPVGGDNECSGRYINLPDGSLTYTSPFLENNKHCVIVVRNTLLHDHLVQIKFQYFEIEESVDCMFDSLKIFSGERKESPELGGPYCGESLHGRTFVSSGNSLRLEFKTDESFALRGFKAEITFEPVYDCTCDENRICIRQGYEKLCLAGKNCNDANCQNDGTCVEKAGEKRCYCKAGFEGDDCSVELDGDTNKALRFRKAPQGRNIQEGHSINPDCELDVPRDIEVQYQWTLDGVPIGAYNSETGFGTHPGGLLAIDEFTEEYEGQYACIATTVLGTAEHTFSYRIVSKCEIEIYPGPGSVKKNVGQNVLLRCHVKPVRKVNRVSWKKNGVPIDYSDGRFEMKTNYYLQISDIKLSDKGSYSCHADDRNGCPTSKKGKLTVLDYQPLNTYCGISTWEEDYGIQSRLSQAAAARVNEHPWHANLRTKDTPSQSFCGGTLISRKFVLTAAHCIDEFKKLNIGPFSSKTVSIFFGTTDCLGGGIKRTVGNYTIHPNYNKNTQYDNDIAIIELDTPVEYGDSIRPICLGEEGFVDETFLEKNYQTSLRSSTGRVAGCGRRSQRGSLHSSLRVVSLPYVPLDQCDESFSEVGKTLTDSMFCAGSQVARTGDACQGDTGGGLVMPTDEHWVLTGIVSYGVGCDVANIYSVYTHVGLFYDWIKEKTKFDEEQVEKFLQERN